MQNLKVSSWEDWEEICRHLLSHIVFQRSQRKVNFNKYGGQGQSQFGVDLVSSTPDVPVVGQCKYINSPLTLKLLQDELAKTDWYSNPIGDYFVFTTGSRQTAVQDIFNRGQYIHSRKDGSKFHVEIIYWSDIQDVSFLPSSLCQKFFPEAYQLPKFPQGNLSLQSDYLPSLSVMKEWIPKWIDVNNLYWLENWNFSLGYVKETDFDPFNSLFIEYDRVTTALNQNIPEFLHSGDRSIIAKCLPAAKVFFDALVEFRMSINSQIISNESDGVRILTINDFPESFRSKTTREWKSNANCLASIYRREVLGEDAY